LDIRNVLEDELSEAGENFDDDDEFYADR